MLIHGHPSTLSDSLQQQLEAEIQHRVEKQSRLLDIALNSIEDFAYVFDRDGCFLYSNQALLRLLGITLEEIIGKNFFDLNYPHDLAARLQQQIQEVFDTGQVVKDETPYTSPTGVGGFYEYIFTPVFAADGTVESVAGSTRDITQRIQAEQERGRLLQQLEAERAKLGQLFDKAPAFVATLSGPQHIFELANPAYLQLVGHRSLLGKPARAALPEVEGQGFFELLDQVFQTGESFIGKELAIQLQREPQGPLEERFVDFVYQPNFDAQGKVSGIFAHGVDITEQVEARRAAQESNRMKDEFLATLSHELRTPLTSILGWARILKSERVTQDETALGLDSIERNAQAQAGLIEDILDISRVITGKLRLEAQPVDLASLIEEAVGSVLPLAEAKSIHLERVQHSGASIVTGDRTRLMQVVWNLLSNAMKFTPRGGSVEIRLEHLSSHVQIIVSDNGQGISPEMLPHIFERFRQADSTSTRAHSGLGLGLALVRHLVEMHGGTVEAQSRGIGQGATFYVRLPLIEARSSNVQCSTDHQRSAPARKMLRDGEANAQANTDAGNSQGLSSCPPELSGLHILIVDDEKDTRELLTKMLERCGAQVTAVGSAQEAFTVLVESSAEARPNVMVSDIGMPEEDGYSLIEKVRALATEHGGSTPALALTAYAGDEDREKILRSGFQFHLSKPVEPLELATVVANLAGRFGDV